MVPVAQSHVLTLSCSLRLLRLLVVTIGVLISFLFSLILMLVQGNFEKAAECYTKALFFDPQHFQSLFNRGFSFDKLGRHEEAIADYSAAIELQPNNSYAYYNRGITRDRQEEFQSAVGDFTKAISFDPNISDFYHNRGFSLRKLVRY
jgi:tetratricopeptide (TPR) repeat protein